jgi:antitoxin component of RelBE/YafQ-DinJ toxin-antitoxin module
MQQNRGRLLATTQLSLRIDPLIVKALRQYADECDMDLSEYIRMLLSRHTYHTDIANEIKRDVFQVREYSQTAISEVYLLKQQVQELEEKLNSFIKADKLGMGDSK